MNDDLTKANIKKHGGRFVIYMSLAAFGFMSIVLVILRLSDTLFVGNMPRLSPEEVVLATSLTIGPGLATAIASYICWRIIMKDEITRRKATRCGRRSVYLAYPIYALILTFTLLVVSPGVYWSSRGDFLLMIPAVIALFTLYGFLLTAIIAIPIGHYIGVMVTPVTFEDKLTAYRKKKCAKRL